MARIKDINDLDGNLHRRQFMCPGCDDDHMVSDGWDFNGDYERPSLKPSIKVGGIADPFGNPPDPTRTICHSFITNGEIKFLNDCTHELRGQTVDLPEMK